MKARVKATGEIVAVREELDLQDVFVQVFYSNEEDPHEVYVEEELDFNVNDNIHPTIDYWTRLEHQYAGMAMQGILSNQDYCKLLIDENNKGSFAEDVSRCASDIAHALIQKLKEKEERK